MVLEFNDAAVAGLYSQLAGVLAGFAFAGLVLVVTHHLSGPPPLASDEVVTETAKPSTESVLLLFASFIDLVLVSLTYALTAGGSDGAVSLAHVIAGVAFAFAAWTLLAAIHFLIFDARLDPEIGRATKQVTAVASWVAVLYVGGGVLDFAEHTGSEPLRWFAVATLLAAIGVTATISFRRRASAKAPLGPVSIRRAASLGMAVAVLASISVAALMSLTGQPSNWAAFICMGIAAAWAVVATRLSQGLPTARRE